jgi:hypothetical protein
MEALLGIYSDLIAIHQRTPDRLAVYWDLDALLLDLDGILDLLEAQAVEKPSPTPLLPFGLTPRDVLDLYGSNAAKVLHLLNSAFPDPATLGGAR